MISVKRIVSPKDEVVLSLVDLYGDLFPPGVGNYSRADILEFVGKQTHGPSRSHVTVEDILLAAMHGERLVGFMFCHFYPNRRKAIVSYLGIDKRDSEARHAASRALWRRVHTILTSGDRHCELLFFDVERPGIGAGVNRREDARRRARIALFKHSARSYGLVAHCLLCDYSSPRITMAPGTVETPLILMVIPLRAALGKWLPRDVVAEFLRFIYLDCYGDIYEVTDPRYESYQTHLREALARCQGLLRDEIEVA